MADVRLRQLSRCQPRAPCRVRRLASGAPAASCSMPRTIRGRSSARARSMALTASENRATRSVRKKASRSEATTMTPTSISPAVSASLRCWTSTIRRSLLAESCTSTPRQTRPPFSGWHFVQSTAPDCLFFQPSASTKRWSRSDRMAAPPFASRRSSTRRSNPVTIESSSCQRAPSPSREILSSAPSNERWLAIDGMRWPGQLPRIERTSSGGRRPSVVGAQERNLLSIALQSPSSDPIQYRPRSWAS